MPKTGRKDVRSSGKKPVESAQKIQIRGLDMPLNAVLLIAIVSLFVYAGTLRAPFIFDDIHTIVKNPYITSLKHIPGFFVRTAEETSKIEHVGWRPVWYTSFALNYRLGKLDPLSYHLTNTAIHFLNAVLVYMIVMLLLRGRAERPWLAAILAGLFFAVHPLQTESVSYIVGRSASMAALFYLLAFYLYIRYRESSSTALVFPACVSFVLAVLSKENAVTLPVMVIIYEYSLKPKSSRRLGGAITLVVLGALFTAARFYIASLNPMPALARPLLNHWMTEVYVVPQYILKVLLPTSLNIDPDVREITSVLDPHFFISLAALIFIFYGLYRLYRADRFAGFFGLWFFVALIPETAIPITDFMAEHRVYLPLVGPAALFGCLFERALISRPVKTPRVLTSLSVSVTAAAVIVALVVMTVKRNEVYASDTALWTDTVRKSPMKARPLLGLGLAVYNMGRVDDALRYINKANELDPNDSYVEYNLALLLSEKRRFGEALKHNLRALELSPDDYYFLTGLGDLYFNMGRPDKAVECFRKSIALKPDYASPHSNLGIIYLGRGQAGEAVKELKTAIELEPHNVQSHSNLGAAYYILGNYNMTVRESAEALRLQPDEAGANYNMARALEKLGDRKGALTHYRSYLSYSAPGAPYRDDAKEKVKTLEKELGK